jgi:hypothetical protein
VRDESGMTAPRSVRGRVSGRQFDPHNAGGLIRQLSPERVQITSRGIDVVERHVRRCGSDPANALMIERLRAIADERLEPTPVDRGCYTHELRESTSDTGNLVMRAALLLTQRLLMLCGTMPIPLPWKTTDYQQRQVHCIIQRQNDISPNNPWRRKTHGERDSQINQQP